MSDLVSKCVLRVEINESEQNCGKNNKLNYCF